VELDGAPVQARDGRVAIANTGTAFAVEFDV
jgi:hypothetical protein